eukprot:8939558-Alexandrium_andersonii.AAC.1
MGYRCSPPKPTPWVCLAPLSEAHATAQQVSQRPKVQQKRRRPQQAPPQGSSQVLTRSHQAKGWPVLRVAFP